MNDQAFQQEFLELFEQLDENDSDAQEAFFSNGRFFPGNVPEGKHLPYDRFELYETRLKLLVEKFPEKFRRCHKGTPYYFLAWTAFDFRDYERAVFYMDAAISEDIKASTSSPTGWHKTPAAKFMFLRKDDPNQAAQRVTAAAQLRVRTEDEPRVAGKVLGVDEGKAEQVAEADFCSGAAGMGGSAAFIIGCLLAQ